MAESTFHGISNNIMDFLNNEAKSVIKFPQSIEEKMEVSRNFESVRNINMYFVCVLK